MEVLKANNGSWRLRIWRLCGHVDARHNRIGELLKPLFQIVTPLRVTEDEVGCSSQRLEVFDDIQNSDARSLGKANVGITRFDSLLEVLACTRRSRDESETYHLIIEQALQANEYGPVEYREVRRRILVDAKFSRMADEHR